MVSGRTVLVTGGARGIGKGIAQAFLEAGERVVIADLGGGEDWNYALGSSAQMAEAVADLSPLGEVDAVPLDVTDAEACSAAVAFTRERFGGIDVLVNNAGVVDSGPVESFPVESWDRIFDVNVKGIYLMTQAALPALRESNDAAVVNTASVAGKRGSRNMSAYCASKFAVVGFTQSLAQEFAPDGIRVNALCPGIVGTRDVARPSDGESGRGSLRDAHGRANPPGPPADRGRHGASRCLSGLRPERIGHRAGCGRRFGNALTGPTVASVHWTDADVCNAGKPHPLRITMSTAGSVRRFQPQRASAWASAIRNHIRLCRSMPMPKMLKWTWPSAVTATMPPIRNAKGQMTL